MPPQVPNDKLKRKLEEWKKRQEQLTNQTIKDSEKKPPTTKREAKPRANKPPASKGSRGQRAASKDGSAASVVRRVPLAKQLKDVIEFLFEQREAVSASQIYQAKGVQVEGDEELLAALKANQKVEYTFDGRFKYKALHDLQNKDELLTLLMKGPEGTHIGDIKDAYTGVLDDVQALKSENLLWILPSFETQESVLYPKDPKLELGVDEDVALLYLQAEVPADPAELEEEVRKVGIKPAMRQEVRKRAPPPPKERKRKQQFRPRTVTNIHLPGLFVDLQPTGIDA